MPPSIGRQKMPQRRHQWRGMRFIPGAKGGADILYDHLPDVINAMRPVHQILSQRGGGNVGHVLVFGDGGNFRLGQPTQCNAILQRNHLLLMA